LVASGAGGWHGRGAWTVLAYLRCALTSIPDGFDVLTFGTIGRGSILTWLSLAGLISASALSNSINDVLAFATTERGNGGTRLGFAYGIHQATAVTIFDFQILARRALWCNDVGGTWFGDAVIGDFSAFVSVLNHDFAWWTGWWCWRREFQVDANWFLTCTTVICHAKCLTLWTNRCWIYWTWSSFTFFANATTPISYINQFFTRVASGRWRFGTRVTCTNWRHRTPTSIWLLVIFEFTLFIAGGLCDWFAFFCDASTVSTSTWSNFINSSLTVRAIQSWGFWTQNVLTLKLLASTFVNDWFRSLAWATFGQNWFGTIRLAFVLGAVAFIQ